MTLAAAIPAVKHGLQYYAFSIMMVALAVLLVLFCAYWFLKVWEQRRIIAHYQREEKRKLGNPGTTGTTVAPNPFTEFFILLLTVLQLLLQNLVLRLENRVLRLQLRYGGAHCADRTDEAKKGEQPFHATDSKTNEDANQL